MDTCETIAARTSGFSETVSVEMPLARLVTAAVDVHMLLKNPSQIGDFGFGGVLSLQARHGALIMHMPVHHTLGGRARCAVMLACIVA